MYNNNGMLRIPTFYFGVLLGVLGVLAFSYFCAKSSEGGSQLSANLGNTSDIYTKNSPTKIINDAGDYNV